MTRRTASVCCSGLLADALTSTHQVIRCEKCLQDERHLLRAQREEAAANAQKHDDAMRQMGGRLAAAADAAAAAESRAQACERDAAARALQDESIMRGAIAAYPSAA